MVTCCHLNACSNIPPSLLLTHRSCPSMRTFCSTPGVRERAAPTSTARHVGINSSDERLRDHSRGLSQLAGARGALRRGAREREGTPPSLTLIQTPPTPEPASSTHPFLRLETLTSPAPPLFARFFVGIEHTQSSTPRVVPPPAGQSPLLPTECPFLPARQGPPTPFCRLRRGTVRAPPCL